MNISMKAAKQVLTNLYNDSNDPEKEAYSNLYNAFRMLRAVDLISYNDMDAIWKHDGKLFSDSNKD